jgi:tetratricopeptide (TPR) repeat protein
VKLPIIKKNKNLVMNSERIKLLKEYYEEDPEDPFNAYALAQEYLREEPLTAKIYFEELLEKHPEYIATYLHAAKLYADLKENELAEKTFELGISIAKENKEVLALRELQSAYNEFLFEDD